MTAETSTRVLEWTRRDIIDCGEVDAHLDPAPLGVAVFRSMYDHDGSGLAL